MRPLLIAECCQNHAGSRETLKRMIHEAATHGADYVKIQAIRARDLARRERFEQGQIDADGTVRVIKRPFAAEHERLARLDLTPDDEQWFVDECRRAGVASMTTPFTRVAAREIESMGYDAVKVASYDCPSYPLLRDLAERWSAIFVSTGACFDQEIARCARVLAGTNFTLLHCVTVYPTPLDAFHLARLSWLRRFTPQVGLSDHSRVAVDGIWASKIALALGASCIERHFTVLEADATKDGPVSIGKAHLAELRAFGDLPRVEQMARLRRDYPAWERALGQARRDLSHEERLNRDYYRGRFASQLGGQVIYNWEDVELDPLLSRQ